MLIFCSPVQADIGYYADLDDKTLFTSFDSTNPFSKSNSQLSIPYRMTNEEIDRDDHGQIKVNKLDKIFDFVDIDSSNDQTLVSDGLGARPKFSEELSSYLERSFSILDYLGRKGKVPKYMDNTLKAFAEGVKRSFYDKKVTRTALDDSLALIFGNRTTVGQVCSYASGLKKSNADLSSVPGFCCMDAPYEADYWGELFSCVEETGENRGKAKGPGSCENLGPYTAGFNQAA